jgi:hypothetical protein
MVTAMVESGRRMVHPMSLVTANGGSSTTCVREWRGCSGIGRLCGAHGRHNAPAGMLGTSRGSSRAFGGFGHGERASDHVGGVGVVAMATEGVTVGRVGSYGSVWTRQGCPELRAGLPVSRWPLGSSRWPRRHGDDGEARGSLRAPAGWSRRVRDLPVASANGTGESRRRQALPAILATAVGAQTGGRVL